MARVFRGVKQCTVTMIILTGVETVGIIHMDVMIDIIVIIHGIMIVIGTDVIAAATGNNKNRLQVYICSLFSLSI